MTYRSLFFIRMSNGTIWITCIIQMILHMILLNLLASQISLTIFTV